jgi:hypothetical protein
VSRAMTHVLTVYITEDQHDAIEVLALSRRVSMSVVVREALDKHISPAEAARDAGDGGDSPPSTPVTKASRAASARRNSASSRWCTPRADALRGRE